MGEEILVRGMGVSPGRGSGKVKVILDIKQIGSFNKGEILVTTMTTPDWVPAMKIAAGIVTDLGGKTCHAANLSRELGVPAVVGCENATAVLKDGQAVTVEGQRGLVFKGDLRMATKGVVATATPVDYTAHITTATKVYVNLSIPDIAKKIADET